MSEDTSHGYLRLMSIIGHELRTPLTVIRGAATLVLQAHDQLPAERREEMLRLIDDNSGTMAERIEDMLSVSHLDGRDLILNFDDVPLREIVDPAVEAARRLALARVDSFDGAADVVVHTDRDRAAQALRSLLTNAVREAGRGASVTLEMTSSDDEVRVDAAYAPREPRAPAREVHSAGELESAGEMALYLARGLARAMGGDAGEEQSGGVKRVWITLRRHG